MPLSAHTDPKNVEEGDSTFIEGPVPVCLEGQRKKPVSHTTCLSSTFRPVQCMDIAVRAAVTVENKARFNESSPGVTRSRKACYLQIAFRQLVCCILFTAD